MAPKRKSDILEPSLVESSDSGANTLNALERVFKKPRGSDATEGSKNEVSSTPRSWEEVELEGENEVCSLPYIMSRFAEPFTHQNGVPV